MVNPLCSRSPITENLKLDKIRPDLTAPSSTRPVLSTAIKGALTSPQQRLAKSIQCLMKEITLLGRNITPQTPTYEDDFPLPQVAYVSSLEGTYLLPYEREGTWSCNPRNFCGKKAIQKHMGKWIWIILLNSIMTIQRIHPSWNPVPQMNLESFASISEMRFLIPLKPQFVPSFESVCPAWSTPNWSSSTIPSAPSRVWLKSW